MNGYADLHCHILSGVDDGADSIKTTREMLRLAYETGTRYLCATPHYSPIYFRPCPEKNAEAFAELRSYAARYYPTLQLFLGNELYYHADCLEALREGRCRTLGGGTFVLVEFSPSESYFALRTGLLRLCSSGYRPLLAHAERYRCLNSHLDRVQELRSAGVRIQVNAADILGKNGLRMKMVTSGLLRHRLADVVASDAHDVLKRDPVLRDCALMIEKKYGAEYAESLFLRYPKKILCCAALEKTHGE